MVRLLNKIPYLIPTALKQNNLYNEEYKKLHRFTFAKYLNYYQNGIKVKNLLLGVSNKAKTACKAAYMWHSVHYLAAISHNLTLNKIISEIKNYLT